MFYIIYIYSIYIEIIDKVLYIKKYNNYILNYYWQIQQLLIKFTQWISSKGKVYIKEWRIKSNYMALIILLRH